MKKVILAVVALLAIGGLGAMFFFVMRSYDNNTYNRRLLIHPATEALLEAILLKLRDEGEDVAFDYIRREVLGKQ